jgi:uncharacterized protein YutE (UPF0331/DUF86 family)
VIEEKLEALRRCVKRIEDRRPDSVAALKSDLDRQDILVLNLTRAVQLSVDIAAHVLASSGAKAPETMGGTFDALEQAGLIDGDLSARMRRAVGFRNVAIHSYAEIDWAIVHSICTRDLDDFRRFAASVAAVLDR